MSGQRAGSELPLLASSRADDSVAGVGCWHGARPADFGPLPQSLRDGLVTPPDKTWLRQSRENKGACRLWVQPHRC
jgi:hypothetical protein